MAPHYDLRAILAARDAETERMIADMDQIGRVFAELDLADAEYKLRSHWSMYQYRWQNLLATSTPVAFRDIPWPLYTEPKSVKQLVPSAIEKFLMGPLKIRNNRVTRRERIEESLLRWHPEKLSALQMRVVQGDQVAVRDGINAVFRTLEALQDGERQSRR